jgi:hypothetical protein
MFFLRRFILNYFLFDSHCGDTRLGVPLPPLGPHASDAWDGFQAEREKLLLELNQQGANPVIMAGKVAGA